MSNKLSRNKAIEVLATYNFEEPPINVKNIIKDLKIGYSESKLTDDISGVLDQRENEKPYIIVNKTQSINRRRFSAAHELGHFLLHSQSGMHVDKKSFYRNSKSSEGLYIIEIEANQFAAELLMPTQLILKELQKYDDFLDSNEDMISALAEKFDVSPTAMSFKIQSVLKDEGYSSF